MNESLRSLGKITWGEDHQPRSSDYDDVYFSLEDGLAETRYVFLESNNLKERWQNLAPGSTFTIAETGFGTGLNFLAAWHLWESMAEEIAAGCSLHFITVEKFPLGISDITRSLQAWPDLASFAKQLVNHYPPQPWHSVQTIPFSSTSNHTVELTIILDDARTGFMRLAPEFEKDSRLARAQACFGEQPSYINAWFLDGFAPAKNPDMWSDALFSTMARISTENTTFATFTAAGSVRRGLTACGFKCEKKSGFGRKREMLTGTYRPVSFRQNHELGNSEPPNTALQAGWNSNNLDAKPTMAKQGKSRRLSRNHTQTPSWPLQDQTNAKPRDKSVVIIGGGIAGCHSANALARRGFSVTLVEAQTLASGASSNLQGAVYTRLSASDDALSYFNRSAQIYADAFYGQNGLYQQAGQQCGVLHLCHDEKATQRLKTFASAYSNHPSFSLFDAEQASEIAGLELASSAVHAKQAGWLSPPTLCRLLAAHKNINVIEHCRIGTLNAVEGGWALTGGGSLKIQASYCIVANAALAKQFDQLKTLPLRNIRGQVSHVESQGALASLRTVLCGEGYVMPPTSHHDHPLQSIGATYNIGDTSCEASDRDHSSNLASLNGLSRSLKNSPNLYAPLPAKVGFRTTTPDYLPIVGPVPHVNRMNEQFQILSKKANAKTDACGAYYPGLYCLLGLGSRGLAYAPLAANIVSRLISGQSMPIESGLYNHVHPARFIIRSLIKNKPISS